MRVVDAKSLLLLYINSSKNQIKAISIIWDILYKRNQETCATMNPVLPNRIDCIIEDYLAINLGQRSVFHTEFWFVEG